MRTPLTAVAPGPTPVDAATVPRAERGQITAVMSRALPSVVSITTREIERDQFNQPVTTQGLGSGIVVDPRGYVLTNAHVVEGASGIKVALTDGRRYRAALVGADRFSDLAVLKVEGTGLPALPLGDSSRLRVGEPVLAIGNPLWIEGGPSVTSGVVSGLGRSMEQGGLPILHNLIQTDAAINPGNSGGPLLDLDGRVIGINTAIIPSAHGIGFAISANAAKPIVHALMAGKRIERPSLGLHAVSVTPQVAWTNDLPIDRGVLVIRVETGGPAEAAGLRADDVITAIDGQPVRDLHELHETLARYRSGQMIDVSFWRDGSTHTLRPVLVEDR